MSIDDLDKLPSLSRGMGLSMWRLLDSPIGTLLCLLSDLKLPCPPECRLPHSLVLLDVLALWSRRLLSPLHMSFVSISMATAKIFSSGVPPSLPSHLHQPTHWLPSTMTGCHTNTATAPQSACHEALVKTLLIQANLSWSPPPLVLLCTIDFTCLFSTYYRTQNTEFSNLHGFEIHRTSSNGTKLLLQVIKAIINQSGSHFAFLIWTVTCCNLALKRIVSEHAYLCANPVIAFCPFQSHLTFVFSSWHSSCFLQSCFFSVCHVAILVNLTQTILFAHCAFDVALSLPHSPAHWLPFASFLIHLLSCFGFCLLAEAW